MFRSFGLIASLVFGGMVASAQTTANVSTLCSKQKPQVCAKVQFLTAISTSSEGQFDVEVKVPAGLSVTGLNADLWMEMGGGHHHGSSPLKISALSAQKYHVEKAYFVMTGPWVIRLNISMGSDVVEIRFPLTVTQ